MAGLPKEILVESRKILKRLEQKKELIEKTVDVRQLSLFGENLEFEDDFEETEKDSENNQFYEEKLLQIEKEKESLQEIVNKIEDYDINNITPMDAMKFLFELKENMKKDN